MISIFKSKTPFIPLVEEIRQGILNGTLLTRAGNKYIKESAKPYKILISWLYKYETCKGEIYLESIDIKWVEEFTKFSMAHNLTKNTIKGFREKIKSILKRLHKRGLSAFNGAGIRTSSELTTAVYNTLAELADMANLDLSKTPGLQRVRDVYIMQCFLGLRYSDFKKILPNINNYIKIHKEKTYFEIKTKKTNILVVIPLARIVKDIINRNKADFKASFSYQHYNRSIKNIAKKAGINNEIIKYRTEGGTLVAKVHLKYHLISNHTARRSFATNAFLEGMPVSHIMQITGHVTEKDFMKYIRCSSIESAIKVAQHPFFKRPYVKKEPQQNLTPLKVV